MASLPFPLPRPYPARPEDSRLAWAIAASVIAHIAIAALLWSIWRALPVTTPPRLGDALVLQAVLDAGLHAAAVPPPEPVIPPAEPTPEVLPAATIPDNHPTPAPGRTTGVPQQEPARTGTEPPAVQGRIAAGPLEDLGRLGNVATLSLAARFPSRVDKEPKLSGPLIMPYPPAAERARISRRVVALLEIDSDGSLIKASILPDDPLFGPAILGVLKHARFSPAEIATQPVPYWLALEFVFSIAASPTHPGSGDESAGAPGASRPGAVDAPPATPAPGAGSTHAPDAPATTPAAKSPDGPVPAPPATAAGRSDL